MKNLILFLSLFLISTSVFSQSEKYIGNSNIESTSTPVEDPRITEIIKNLKAARTNGDAIGKKYWESKLHELTKPQIISSTPHNFVMKNEMTEVSNSSEVMNVTRITNSLQVANSISRERVNGDIYAAIGYYGSPTAPDTIKVFRSTNNGINFTLIFSLTEGDLKITNNGLDVEAVSKGDSSFAFVTMDYTIGGEKSCAIIRVRQDGNALGILVLAGGTSKKFTNARITSDNASYTTAAYVYVSVTVDSNAAGGRNLKSKAYRIENPYSPFLNLITCYQNAANGQYGYYVAGVAPSNAVFESDIAFVNTTGNVDQIYTVTVVSGVPGFFGEGTAFYLTRSSDYGATIPALFNTLSDVPYFKANPRIAATGYLNNTAMVSCQRVFTNGDWDPYYNYFTDITTGTLTPGFASTANDTTTWASVTAKYRSNGTYLFSYHNKRGVNASDVFIRPFSAGTLGTNVQANPPGTTATTIFGLSDAAFRNVNNDSCLVIWGGFVGIGSYVTGGCDGAVTSVGSSSVQVNDFRLNQNYPNPFNPATRISYSIPVQSKVLIKLYDVLGKQVAELVNEVKSAGAYSIDFNASGFTSGVYYYKIEAGDFSSVRKMMLVK